MKDSGVCVLCARRQHQHRGPQPGTARHPHTDCRARGQEEALATSPSPKATLEAEGASQPYIHLQL